MLDEDVFQKIIHIYMRLAHHKKTHAGNNSCVQGGVDMANKEKKIEGRFGFNSQNGSYGLLVSDLWQHTGFHCGECLEVKVDDKWIQTRMKMDINHQWYLVDTPYSGDLEYVWARI